MRGARLELAYAMSIRTQKKKGNTKKLSRWVILLIPSTHLPAPLPRARVWALSTGRRVNTIESTATRCLLNN